MNIFVAKLSFETRSEDLREIFQDFGEVSSANVILDKHTGRSKGFGFVEMTDDTEANNAINELDNSELDGRRIVVKVANPPKKKFENSRSRGGW